MMGRLDSHGHDGVTVDSFAYKYGRLTTDAAESVRSRVLGSPVPNGYTTVAQADRIAEALGVGPGDVLLDVGSGRGWPGARIAARSGCAAVVTDLPLNALRQVRLRAPSTDRRSQGTPTAVCADGAHLPFRDACFDAVTHSDVLC